jgi:hypothetical protein
MLNRWLCSVALVVAAVAYSSSARAQDFKPFDNVTNVCPKCPALGLDKLTLKDGTELTALIVAENPMFYVLRKYGEFRAVGKDKVDKVEKSPDATREPGHEDQILMKNGLVVSGKILREREDTGMYEIQIAPGKVTMVIYKPVIQVVFKAGKQAYPAK